MQPLYDECHLFGVLRSALRSDLCQTHGIPNPVAGAILNWFDPASPEYLDRVNEWQVGLCQGYLPLNTKFPYPLHRDDQGYPVVYSLPPHLAGAIQQVAKLVYKWHGQPRKKTDMDEVKERLRHPLPMQLGTDIICGIRTFLSGMKPPDIIGCIGRFGPGVTCEGLDGREKWDRLGTIMPDLPPDFFRFNSRDTWSPPPIGRGVTKIAEVPKTIKSNRIVSSEPALYMYAQLAVADDLDRQMHQLYRKHVSLHDAELHNGFLRRHGACSIDLSDASDHVSMDLVKAVLPQLWPVLARVRSSASLFPDGEEVDLSTFAPMGSGVCFPILTLVCIGICGFAKHLLAKTYPWMRQNLWFHVYGDDIIVPQEMYSLVCSLLTFSGLKVNEQKSCPTGIYRESCGLELYDDVEITPAYLRDPLQSVPATKVESACGILVARGFDRTAEAVADLSNCARYFSYDSNLQRSEMCVRTISARQKTRSLEGWSGLNRWNSLHTLQDEIQGATVEVWTRPAWRLRASADYPYLSTWLATRCKP